MELYEFDVMWDWLIVIVVLRISSEMGEDILFEFVLDACRNSELVYTTDD